jgi:predicted RNase H-like HicB family nuclease
MRIVEIRIEKSTEEDWWVTSDEAVGFFACGDTKEEALVNAKDALSIFLNIEEEDFNLKIIETKVAD